MEKRFINWQKPVIEEGKPTKYNWVAQGVEHFELGNETDIGAFVYIQAKSGVVIEDFVQVGGGVKIYSLDTISGKHGKVILKRNCCVGANSVILPNVTIGENSVIGACSVVKNGTVIPPNEIWAGCPAKRIGVIANEKREYAK